jgi:hypothetical protein
MNLAPDHKEDLQRSGLSDDTIEAHQVASVPPGEIRLPGVESAYRFPYFGLDGKPTRYERRKLFPPIVGPNGTQKYYQEPDTPPMLYMSPLRDWASIASDPERPLIITEGEKKAAAGCQAGLAVLGVAGVWNWRQRLDSGERLVLPTLDQFIWKGRDVELVPDSDVWRPDKQQALDGFYALAQELISRGATVHFVMLPEGGSMKIGLDDWFVKTGSDWVHQWPVLQRIAPDDPRCAKTAKRWQKWREKQAREESLRQVSNETMEVADLAGANRVSFPDQHVVLIFGRLTENARGVSAEIVAKVGGVEVLGETDINLKSDTSRDKLARSLSLTANHIPWKRLLERACAEVLKRHRRGEPILELYPADSTHTPFIINRVVYRGHQTLIFAPGGSYKSYIALFFALVATAGIRQSGVSAVKTNVLYLDWELDAETVGARLKAIHTGHPELAHVRPYYRRCTAPLHHEAPQIAAEVDRLGVGLIIIDSAAMACGGELNSPESAIKLQQALRRIGCASIVLAHVSKATPDGQERSAYGSVFFRELARNVWELSRPEGSDRVVLSQTGAACKNSFGRKQDPLGFEFSFQADRVQISAFNPADEGETGFEDKLPLWDRIQRLLADRTPRCSKDIATELRAQEASVKVTLSSRRDLFARSGAYHKGVWALTDSAQAHIQSLKSIVNAPIVNGSLRSLIVGSASHDKPLNSEGKEIVKGIVNDRSTRSLINGEGYINTPPLTINDLTINTPTHSQPEEVLDLED